MANPQIINIPEWIWTKVATSVTTGIIHRLESKVYYYQTFRLAGEAAPSAPVQGAIPVEAIRMFDQGEERISSSELLDVYIMGANSDDDAVDTGKIRIDL